MKYRAKDGIKVERSEKINLLRGEEDRKTSQTHIFIKIYILILNISRTPPRDMNFRIDFAAMGNVASQGWRCSWGALVGATIDCRSHWRDRLECGEKYENLEHYTSFISGDNYTSSKDRERNAISSGRRRMMLCGIAIKHHLCCRARELFLFPLKIFISSWFFFCCIFRTKFFTFYKF